MQVYNDEHMFHTGVKGMKWGRRSSKKVDFYNKERNKDQDSNYLEKSKLRKQYDNGKMSYRDYVNQNVELGKKHTQKSLDNAKKTALSNMSEKEQQKFKKNTSSGKKQADILLEKIARGGEASFIDKLSLHGFK